MALFAGGRREICQLLPQAVQPRIVQLGQRLFSAEPAPSESDDSITVTVNPFKGHRLEPPGRDVQTNKKELLDMFETMVRMRRTEIAADLLYKQKLARGFLHLADGQEAVPVGIEAALDFKDSMIQSYRDHCTFLGRGGTVKELFAELLVHIVHVSVWNNRSLVWSAPFGTVVLDTSNITTARHNQLMPIIAAWQRNTTTHRRKLQGKKDGCARGLGGSMHMYKREHNFFGGIGIVGEQCPLGAGLAFAHKYRNDGHVAMTLYGDGAANQGQLYEAFNMAAIWDLPCIFVCENNHYGMGTAERRASKSAAFYTRGDYVPGMWIDGMDCLAVKQGVAFAKQWALEKGPIVLEMDTYRYHGHSISDPGSTYRTRDEISGIRRARDPIEHIKTLLTEHKFADGPELKKREKQIKREVEGEIEAAKKSEFPPIEDLWNNIYADGLGAKLRPIEISKPKIQL